MHDYKPDMPGAQIAKTAAPTPSLQETVLQTLGMLREAHSYFDDLDGAPGEVKTQPPEPAGLVEGVSMCQAQANALVQRLLNLRNRLGRL